MLYRQNKKADFIKYAHDWCARRQSCVITVPSGICFVAVAPEQAEAVFIGGKSK